MLAQSSPILYHTEAFVKKEVVCTVVLVTGSACVSVVHRAAALAACLGRVSSELRKILLSYSTTYV